MFRSRGPWLGHHPAPAVLPSAEQRRREQSHPATATAKARLSVASMNSPGARRRCGAADDLVLLCRRREDCTLRHPPLSSVDRLLPRARITALAVPDQDHLLLLVE